LEHLISASHVEGRLGAPETTARSLDDLLQQCIDEVLSDLLGTRAREAVYDHLERNYKLSRREIPRHMNKFLELLEETFGKGSKTIGKAIIKRLYGKLEWDFYDNPGYEFMDHLDAIRARIARTLIEHAKSRATT
jgi:rRNA pseudouridine-1189 N-methylase Emg1 (Nep1/Mra1 family)